jgi:hypothetical protein
MAGFGQERPLNKLGTHMKLTMRLVVLLFALAFADIAFAKAPYEMKDIVLLQPESVLQERISVDTLGAYIRSVNASAAEVLAGRDYKPTGGFLVVAIRPGNQSAVWIDTDPVLPTDLSRELVARLRAIAPPTVGDGPVVFAVRVSLWGGAPSTKNTPSPEAWEREAKAIGRPLEVGELVERVWPR